MSWLSSKAEHARLFIADATVHVVTAYAVLVCIRGSICMHGRSPDHGAATCIEGNRTPKKRVAIKKTVGMQRTSNLQVADSKLGRREYSQDYI